MKHGRVLLADSHLNMLEGVHGLLETLFDTVVMVADERSLVQAVATFKPDLVVVDLSLPVLEGVNITRQLHARFPDLRVIVLSVYDEPVLARQLLEAGVAGFVLKRAAATDLVPAVQEVLRGGVYVSAAAQQGPHEAGNHLPTGFRDESRSAPPVRLGTTGVRREPQKGPGGNEAGVQNRPEPLGPHD